MIKPSDLTWDEIVRVGAGTLGGNYLRAFWRPVALADEVRDVPVPAKILGEELVFFRDLAGELTLLGATVRTAGLRSSTASFKPMVIAAPAMAGATTGAAGSSIVPPSRSRPGAQAAEQISRVIIGGWKSILTETIFRSRREQIIDSSRANVLQREFDRGADAAFDIGEFRSARGICRQRLKLRGRRNGKGPSRPRSKKDK